MKNYKDHEIEIILFRESDAFVATEIVSGNEFNVGGGDGSEIDRDS